MGFTCGIVGLPNVGKSTIFNALTSGKAASANFPFCTIEPNTGAVPVPDPRLSALAEIAKSAKIIPTQLTFVDIAGLIKGASKGEGLGNQFLGHIRGVDAIAHVVRCFENDDIIHVDSTVDPLRDVDTILTELVFSDFESCLKAIARLEKAAKSGDKEIKKQLTALESLKEHLAQGSPASKLDEEECISDIRAQMLTSKPMLLVANVSEDELSSPPTLDGSRPVDKLFMFAQEHHYPMVMISGQVESELAELDAAERTEYMEALGMEASGLDQLCLAGYKLLGLLTFFTVGPKEAHAWTAPVGYKAPQCAGKIHSDFERGFIRAEVISFDDYVEHKGETGAREKGRLRVEGKEYLVEDGDVVHFRFNV